MSEKVLHKHGCEERHGDSCSCGHDHEHHGSLKAEVVKMSISLFFLILGLIPIFPNTVKLIFFIFSAVISGYETFIEGIRAVFKKQLDEHFLLIIAVLAAFISGEYVEATVVSLLFALGEFFEQVASARSKRSIEKLWEIQSDEANVIDNDGKIKKIHAKELSVGDTIAIFPHERIPVDCTVTEGSSDVDTCAVTGESLPMEAHKGSQLLSGMLNGNKTLRATVTHVLEESTASRIIKMARDAVTRKGNSEKLITRFAKIYTPIVLLCGVLIIVIPSLITGDWEKWLKSGLVFWIASCPCALVISVPLGFFSGIGSASKQGIIIKGGKYMEALSGVKCAAFDKTGTLTDDVFEISEIKVLKPYTQEELLEYAAAAEMHSDHPIARSVMKYCGAFNEPVEAFSEYPGGGTSVVYKNKKILCGGKRLMEKYAVDINALGSFQIYIALDGKAAGAIGIRGRIRKDTKATIEKLKKLGIKKTVMLTGDNEQAAQYVANECGIDEYHAKLLPEDKLEIFEKIREKEGSSLYVGDGINDAPVLSGANVGVAMGLGTDTAMEAADVILVSGKLGDLPNAISIARKTMSAVKFNIIFALSVKFIVLALAASGLAFLWLAVFADVGVSIVAIINSSMLLKYHAK